MTIDIPNCWLWLFAGAFLMNFALAIIMPGGKERRWQRFWTATLLEASIICLAFAVKG